MDVRRCLMILMFARIAAADPPKPDLYVEDPYAPHHTWGSLASVGTAVGFIYGLPQTVTEVGIVAGAGHRFGRLSLEVEGAYSHLEGQSQYMTPLGETSGDLPIGRSERLDAVARFDVLRLGSHVAGPNSMMALFVEGGGGMEWLQFTAPLQNGVRPDNTHRLQGIVGFGFVLDHRLQEPIGFPHRIAWLLGLRFAMSPHEAMTTTVCHSTTICAREAMPEPSEPSPLDQSMLFHSSLAFTF